MKAAKAAIGRAHLPIAVFALLILTLALAGCSSLRGPAAPVATPDHSAESMATVEPPADRTDRRSAPPRIPTVSAALEDRPPLRGQAPIRLAVPDLGIDVPVEPVGLDDDGRMGLPANPSIAAWYSYGVAPGDPAGSAVIAAHVDSIEYDIGPFARLADAPRGTLVEVTSADGSVRGFSLDSTQVVLKGTVDWQRVFRRGGSPVLTLVTCGGEFDWDARRYLSSVIVTALATG
ncbi:class F sortase [Agromyces sp. NPDC058110]|uniref:class F sortase n=1 Tax=Agromyces sp. NPDC058110 TaxID=3346345 RepID=UPI0036DCD449